MSRDIETRWCNHFCLGKELIIVYYECVFVAFGIQHAMRMPRIVICGVTSCTVFLHIVT